MEKFSFCRHGKNRLGPLCNEWTHRDVALCKSGDNNGSLSGVPTKKIKRDTNSEDYHCIDSHWSTPLVCQSALSIYCFCVPDIVTVAWCLGIGFVHFAGVVRVADRKQKESCEAGLTDSDSGCQQLRHRIPHSADRQGKILPGIGSLC